MAIDRYALVTRHNPVITGIDAYAPLSVGNGEFAFTADITGLQTFPEAYQDGIPLCTQSQWGWHTRPAKNEQRKYDINDLSLEMIATKSRKVGYRTDPTNQKEAYNWLRMNPHRLHLGRIGLDIVKGNREPAYAEDIQNAQQTLDLWKGLLTSQFEVEGHRVKTQTCASPDKDMVSFLVESDLFALEQMGIEIAFPYGTHDKTAADWENETDHATNIVTSDAHGVTLQHNLDSNNYTIQISYSKGAKLVQTGKNSFRITPVAGKTQMEFSCLFSQKQDYRELPSFEQTRGESERHWNNYWNNGGMIELKNSSDERAMELERRIILSQYLMAVNCAGSLPPQETGLTFNSWYGKFHLEMHWWHGVHFPLWGRAELFEKSLGWYNAIAPKAREIAAQQGYDGVRWPKMTSYEGVDAPSPIGPLLIWQQPHPIYYAELLYRVHPNRETLEKYKDIVLETAKFMASYTAFNPEHNRYDLGPGLIPAQENHQPQDAVNPTFELEYWAFGLNTANEWRKRLSMDPIQEWSDIAQNLAPLPVQGGVYLAHENCPDTFTRFNEDHPSMLGALGVLPGIMVDHEIMLNTLNKVLSQWKLSETWGWDFAVMAMSAARLERPELAVDCLLLDEPKNEYLVNGHNKQADKKDLPIYLPGNGGLLTAVAMMAAGWEGCKEETPGFPKDGSWCVTWEGLHPML